VPSHTIPQPDFSYRFDLLLEIIKRFAFPARQKVYQNRLWRVTQGQLVAYSQTNNRLKIEYAANDSNSSIVSASRHILGLDYDLSAFYHFVQSNEKLKQVIEPLIGVPIFCTETVFEALITLIIEQHISWKNALRAQQALMAIFDTKYTNEDIVVYDFPSPEQLAQATPDQLKPLKITNRRMDLIIQISQDVANGDLDLELLHQMETKSAYDMLLQIKGIGHWTANNVLGRGLGRFPYISHNDVALQAAVQYYFHDDDSKKSAQQVIDTLEVYGGYAGLVGHFTLLRWVLDRYPIVESDALTSNDL